MFAKWEGILLNTILLDTTAWRIRWNLLVIIVRYHPETDVQLSKRLVIGHNQELAEKYPLSCGYLFALVNNLSRQFPFFFNINAILPQFHVKLLSCYFTNKEIYIFILCVMKNLKNICGRISCVFTIFFTFVAIISSIFMNYMIYYGR